MLHALLLSSTLPYAKARLADQYSKLQRTRDLHAVHAVSSVLLTISKHNPQDEAVRSIEEPDRGRSMSATLEPEPEPPTPATHRQVRRLGRLRSRTRVRNE